MVDAGRNNEKSRGTSEKVAAFKLEFRLTQPDNSVLSEAGEASFNEDVLVIKCESGRTISHSVRNIADFEIKDYRIVIRLLSGETLELYYLGYQYEAFAEMLISVRNTYIKEDLLLHEKLLFTAESIRYQHFGDNGVLASTGDCNAQVSETALLLAEPGGNHLKFPLSFVVRILDEDYSLKILMETGDVIVLSMLGRQREPLLLKLEWAVDNLLAQARLICNELFPDAAEPSLKMLPPLFKDGRAVTKASLDAASPNLWPVMEKRLDFYGIAASYDYLRQHGEIGRAAIGFKRGLMGELTGEYVWFLIPVKSSHGLMLAMEAGNSEGSGGRATYFYSVPGGQGGTASAEQVNNFIRLINYSLLMVNFRREPINLSDEMLKKPNYHQYRYAIERLPSLRLLRSLFAGRALHSSEDNWKKEVSRITGMSDI